MSEAVEPIAKTKSAVQWVLIIALTMLVAIAALPNYISGQWPWSADLQVPQLKELRALTDTPLALDGWNLTAHQTVKIGGSSWSLAEYQASDDPPGSDVSFALLLRPQNAHDKQPEVEWVDIQGSQRWRVNDLHTVRLTISDEAGQPLPVSTRYFRGLNENGTLAVMQWYAWPSGGHFAPGKWFWADQAQQWQQRERMPWVAVSLLLPIEPVGDIRPHTDTMVAIAQAVQKSLLSSALEPR